MTTFRVPLPDGVDRDALVAQWTDAGSHSLPVLGPLLPESRQRRDGESEGVGFASVMPGLAGNELLVTVDSLDTPVGSSVSPSFMIGELSALVDENGALAGFRATASSAVDGVEGLPGRDEDDDALIADEDDGDGDGDGDDVEAGAPGNMSPAPSLPKETREQLSALLDEGVIALEDLNPRTRIALSKGAGKRHDNMPGQSQLWLRSQIESMPGANPGEKVLAYIRHTVPEANGARPEDLARICGSLLREAGLAYIPVPTVEVTAPFASSRGVDPRQVPLASTSSSGRTGTGDRPVVDLRGHDGRNRLERGISWLKAHRPGFDKLTWERQIELGSELLQTSASVIDEVG